MSEYDFSGYATRANMLCSDGRVIVKGAFIDNDKKRVPLVWQHQYDGPDKVLGHFDLENVEDGMYGYGKFNDTEKGKMAKALVMHGDVTGLSIRANNIKLNNQNVEHGNILEVSLVLAGANPGAYIDSIISHGECSDDEAIIYSGEDIMLEHSDCKPNNKEPKEPDRKEPEQKEPENKEEKSIKDVFETLNEEQKELMYTLVAQAIEDGKKQNDGGNDDMKHNVFDKGTENDKNVLTHSAQEDILKMAKNPTVGTFQSALRAYADENSITHDAITTDPVSGFVDGSISQLWPEYHDMNNGAPPMVLDDQGWVSTVIGKVSKVPFSRIRTNYVDLRNIDTLRAKGYQKGTKKTLAGNYALARRTTDPQTIYVKSALNRDDIIDITDFDIVAYQYNIDRMNLDMELANAILFGDGREVGDDNKIAEDKIRPVWTDDELYTLHRSVDPEYSSLIQGTGTLEGFGESYTTCESFIDTCLFAREKFKGSGTPDMFIAPHALNVMLLARDKNGRRIYSSKAELAQTLNVGNIYTIEQMSDKRRTDEHGNVHGLVALIVNLADYALGSTKGGQVAHFTQFDIDFNQQKSLLETRLSGALTKLWSALAIEVDIEEEPTGE